MPSRLSILLHKTSSFPWGMDYKMTKSRIQWANRAQLDEILSQGFINLPLRGYSDEYSVATLPRRLRLTLVEQAVKVGIIERGSNLHHELEDSANSFFSRGKFNQFFFVDYPNKLYNEKRLRDEQGIPTKSFNAQGGEAPRTIDTGSPTDKIMNSIRNGTLEDITEMISRGSRMNAGMHPNDPFETQKYRQAFTEKLIELELIQPDSGVAKALQKRTSYSRFTPASYASYVKTLFNIKDTTSIEDLQKMLTHNLKNIKRCPSLQEAIIEKMTDLGLVKQGDKNHTKLYEKIQDSQNSFFDNIVPNKNNSFTRALKNILEGKIESNVQHDFRSTRKLFPNPANGFPKKTPTENYFSKRDDPVEAMPLKNDPVREMPLNNKSMRERPIGVRKEYAITWKPLSTPSLAF